ncbi:MAG: glucose-6-phosphate dehydrogenase assembly protein OpcA, partial [Candidatus Eremiobacteraeota bacterium]|nr:glucose-6-phosphate dehydrogenase assembly protein OpcA [Candidatus Eremiobacteraeota bacterium]
MSVQLGAAQPMAPVAVANIETALTQSWRELARKQGTTLVHACSLTLLIWVDQEAAGRGVLEAVNQLAGKHPIRAIVVSPEEGMAEGSVAAWFANGCDAQTVDPICSEEILLRAHPQSTESLASAVRGLLVADLPIYLWWRGGSPSGHPLFSALCGMADRVVVDSIRFGDGPAALDTLRRLVQRNPGRVTVRDLNWQRTEPWRNALAACFDDHDVLTMLPHLDRCSVTYSGTDGSSASARSMLIYGWLASRFPALRGRVRIAPGKHWADIAHGRIVAISLNSAANKCSLMLVRQQSPTGITAEARALDGRVMRRWTFQA